MTADPGPLASERLMRRSAPFLVAALIGFLTLPLPPKQLEETEWLLAALAVVLLIPLAAVAIPWRSLPRQFQAVPPLLYIVVVALLREAEGGAVSGFAVLLLVPVFWFALYGTRGELIAAVIGGTVALLVPILVAGEPEYPPSEWRRAILLGAIATMVGFSVQALVAEVRRRVDEVGEERRRLGAIVEHLSEGVVACDREGAVTLVNKAAREMYGMADAPPHLAQWPRTYGTRRPGSSQPLPSEEMPILRALDGETVVREELLMAPQGGDVRCIEVSAEPIVDSSGGRRGAVAVVHDITAQKEVDRLKDEFFALVSHELRTPLTSIVGYVELLLEDEDDGEQAKLLEVVARNARRLQRLVGDVLFITQLQVGEMPLEPGVADLEALARDSVEALDHRARRKAIELNLETEPVPSLSGDSDRLGQVIDNLVSNAVKYTPEGGRIDVRLVDAGELVAIEVSDTGYGIPAEQQERVFDRFFRASTATDRVIEGVGLGLAVVKAIVEGHGGTISLTSEEGVGTTFRVELPKSGRPETQRIEREVVTG